MQFRRRWREALALGVGAVVLGVAGSALAGHFLGDVESYTGCLSREGALSRLKAGDSPLRPCASNQVEVHLSGGDITSIIAGTGLTGGAENGGATLSLDPAYQLPQDCEFGQVAKWSPSGWVCADDEGEPGPLPQ